METLIHPVHRSINRALLVAGVERKLFFLALIVGAASFTFFSSLLTGILVFGTLYGFARWATATDPKILQILLNASRLRAEYDPAKQDFYRLHWRASHGTD